ncbi:MAG: glycine--tRNA ligase [Candidatus Amoebophilus sp. 36-38]|nr:MAG: glycine--tRNA ligase [Candidatus Amoebophilus sp. 36-38]
MSDAHPNSLLSIVAHAKEYGFIYPSSEIYEGLQAVYDYAPYGAALKRNVQSLWWQSMTQLHSNIVGMDAAILMHPRTWQASGHVDSFEDLMVDNKDSKKRYRVDVLIENHTAELAVQGNAVKAQEILARLQELLQKQDLAGLHALLLEEKIVCPIARTTNWTEVRRFNLMFATKLGAQEDGADTIYLRPETAQGIFVNFLNVQKTVRMKIPFGIAQIGKAFRNEIVARQFIFRMREFEQMEMQFFIQPGNDDKWFNYWQQARWNWHLALGLPKDKLRIKPHDQLAHYAKAAVDIEYHFPFGYKEIEGIHARSDFDLKNHEVASKKKMQYFDPELNQNYLPHVIETSVGCDRLILMLLCEAFTEETIMEEEGAKTRTYLKLHPALAPIKAAIFPLIKRDNLPQKAQEIFESLKYDFPLIYEENQSIGKRYARQDLIGTPYCITVDHQTLTDDTVTIRERDSMQQQRMPINILRDFLLEKVSFKTILAKLPSVG